MAIETIQGDIWAQKRGVLVHGCNAQGKMGAGAALEFKNQFPSAFAQYEQAWKEGRLKLGEVIFCELGPELWGACAITQEYYGKYGGRASHADLGAIEKSFEKVAAFAAERSLPVLFIKVGSGYARGIWEEIEPVIHRALGPAGGTLVDRPAQPNARPVGSGSRAGARAANAQPREQQTAQQSGAQTQGNASAEPRAPETPAAAAGNTTGRFLPKGWGGRH